MRSIAIQSICLTFFLAACGGGDSMTGTTNTGTGGGATGGDGAAGGSTGGDTSGVGTAPASYLTLADTSMAASRLGGSILVSVDTGQAGVSAVTGSLVHDTRAFDVDAGFYRLVDPDGFAGNNLDDGTATLS